MVVTRLVVARAMPMVVGGGVGGDVGGDGSVVTVYVT